MHVKKAAKLLHLSNIRCDSGAKQFVAFVVCSAIVLWSKPRENIQYLLAANRLTAGQEKYLGSYWRRINFIRVETTDSKKENKQRDFILFH